MGRKIKGRKSKGRKIKGRKNKGPKKLRAENYWTEKGQWTFARRSLRSTGPFRSNNFDPLLSTRFGPMFEKYYVILRFPVKHISF